MHCGQLHLLEDGWLGFEDMEIAFSAKHGRAIPFQPRKCIYIHITGTLDPKPHVRLAPAPAQARISTVEVPFGDAQQEWSVLGGGKSVLRCRSEMYCS